MQREFSFIDSSVLQAILILVVFVLGCPCLIGQVDIEVFDKSNSELLSNKIWDVTVDENGAVWLGTDVGLGSVLNDEIHVLNSINDSVSLNSVRALFSHNSSLYVGTFKNGLFVFSENDTIQLNKENSLLPSNHIKSILLDQNGNLWVGTISGLVLIDKEKNWMIFTKESGDLPLNNITSIAEGDSSIFVGTVNGGLLEIIGEKESLKFINYDKWNSQIPDKTVLDLKVYKNILLIASPTAGLVSFDGDTFDQIDFLGTGELVSSCTGIEVDSKDNVYAVSNISGMSMLLPNDTLIINEDNFLPENNLTCIQKVTDSTFYIGTANSGLIKMYLQKTDGIEERITQMDIFPNPATDFLVFENWRPGTIVHCSNLNGITFPIEVDSFGFADVSGFENGVYLIVSFQFDSLKNQTISSARFLKQ